ncbi:MAG: response regulator [Magnetococcales bacterium]|nr:response regulator [Magnetococcales bacterium]
MIDERSIPSDPDPCHREASTRLLDFQHIIHTLFQYAFEPVTPGIILSKALDLLLSISWIPSLRQGMIFSYDPIGKRLVLTAHRGIDVIKATCCVSVELGQCLCGQAVETRKNTYLSVGSENFQAILGSCDPEKSNYIIPIIHGKEVLGLVNIFFPLHFIPSIEDESYLKIYFETLAGVIKWRQSEEIRKRTEMANKEKSEFLANMSHEMRTPMNAIIGLSDLALSSCREEKTRDYLRKISKSSHSLLTLINDILDLSKIEAGLMELHSVDFTLREIFDHLADIFVDPLGKKNIDLFFYMSHEWELYLRGDEQRLKQILINLISNAIKFTETGKVEVSVTIIHQQNEDILLRFLVMDTGIGIKKDVIDSLFQPYTQGDNSITRRYGGSGLGLAISKRLAERMNGRIWVESHEGEGSCFYLEIPFHYHSTDRRYHKTAALEDMTGLNILLVTADPTTGFTLKQAIDMFTFVATIASTYDYALRLLQEREYTGNPFDLILLDWNLEAVDSSFCKMLSERTDQPSPKLILLVSANKDDEIFAVKYAFNADAIISKPINYSYLFDLILTVFGKDHPKVYKKSEEHMDMAKIIEKIGGARILLVEDHEINRQVAQELMEGAMLHVHACSNGHEAVMEVNKNTYDAVIMDIHMPIMDGLRASQRIRETFGIDKLPIIALSAAAMLEDQEKCLAAGMNGYVSKPINQVDLFNTLLAHINPRVGLGIKLSSDRVLTLNDQNATFSCNLEEIDMEACRTRYEGKRELFVTLLRQFKSNYSDVGEKVRIALQSGDLTTAREWVHAIAGISGNLAAKRLYEKSLALESAILSQSADAYLGLFEEFFVLLQRLLGSLEQFFLNEEKQPDLAQRVEQGDWHEMLSLMSQLGESIHKYEYNARKYLAQLKPMIRDTEQCEELNKIQGFLDRVDYKNAAIAFTAFVKMVNADH